MTKVIRLKESDIQRMVNIVLTEQYQSQQASMEVPQKYNEVIKGIEGISNKIKEAISNLQHKSKNLPIARDTQEAGEELKKSFTDLLKLLASTNEVEVNTFKPLIQKVDSYYNNFNNILRDLEIKGNWGSKVKEPLKNLDSLIGRTYKTFDEIAKRNVSRRKTNAQIPDSHANKRRPIISPVEFLLQTEKKPYYYINQAEDRLRGVNKNIESWWEIVSDQLLGPEETPQLEPEEMTSSNPLEPPQ